MLMDKGAVGLAFIDVLKMNLEVAKKRGWANKVAVFTRLYERIRGEFDRRRKAEARAAREAELARQQRHHAPVFTDSGVESDDQGGAMAGPPGGGGGATAAGGGSGAGAGAGAGDDAGAATGAGAGAGAGAAAAPLVVVDAKDAFEDAFVDCTGLGGMLEPSSFAKGGGGGGGGTKRKAAGGKKQRGKKKQKKSKALRTRIGARVGAVGRCLARRGWCVADRFASADLVNAVLAEVEALEPHFEQSEIWVGKTADVGAQIRVPSVRGDSVLWMCGAHPGKGQRGHRAGAAFDSTGVQPRTRGEVGPCDPEIKARLPLARFTALRELIRAVDKLVFEQLGALPAGVCEPLADIVERSDAMLARRSSAEHLIATKALRCHSYGLESHCR